MLCAVLFFSPVVNLPCGKDWQNPGEILGVCGLVVYTSAVPISLKLPLSWINRMKSLCKQGRTQTTAHLQAAHICSAGPTTAEAESSIARLQQPCMPWFRGLAVALCSFGHKQRRGTPPVPPAKAKRAGTAIVWAMFLFITNSTSRGGCGEAHHQLNLPVLICVLTNRWCWGLSKCYLPLRI